jgi:hypothetical protein
MVQKQSILSGIHAIALLLFFISFVLPYWAYAKHNSEYYGLFYKEEESHIRLNVCTTNTGQTQCALLKSSKVAGVLSFILGAFAMLVPLFYNRSPLKQFYTFLLHVVELIFAISCLTLFVKYASSYLDINDDINWQTSVSKEWNYQIGFYLWCLGSSLVAVLSFDSIKTLYFNKKE